ncbi:hypothetical protein WR25_14715 [Diploscapter pachys]|uniref:Uncharacterized protein n=1 Tax=Diploscapter pachys TaxID=2018661 RepID=A0A2A2J9Y4_9BILA|nr:hypothetical protein WR25_14715 [Diploscapter pachys]
MQKRKESGESKDLLKCKKMQKQKDRGREQSTVPVVHSEVTNQLIIGGSVCGVHENARSSSPVFFVSITTGADSEWLNRDGTGAYKADRGCAQDGSLVDDDRMRSQAARQLKHQLTEKRGKNERGEGREGNAD